MKKSVWLLLIVLGFFASCEERKVETAYDSLSGEWYLYAVYLNGGNSDVLADLIIIYPCIGSSTATFSPDSTFRMDSDCEDGKTHGKYSIKGDSVFATDTANVQQILLFKDSALYQKRIFLGIGTAELRFQKTVK
ncbi:MAG: lipocalin family protein [Paludibacteraceae bacterium]|nr:lipocalin family protein [Paludibacteraceae bacterium]